MEKSNFIILKKIKVFIVKMEKVLLNFPKKDILSRDFMYHDILELLEIIYIANYESDLAIKKSCQIKALAKINKIDFFIERAFSLGHITEKECSSRITELNEINAMIYTWCKNGK
ncbi:MAG: four helix bundle protein [Bacilli bacterium]